MIWAGGILLQDFQASATYRVTLTYTNAGGTFDGNLTIASAPGVAAVTTPIKVDLVGTHTVSTEFLSAASTTDFILEVDSATAGVLIIDNIRWSRVAVTQEDSSLQHLVCGHTLEDWTGGAAQGSVRIMARCI